jgi:hypothetical protein
MAARPQSMGVHSKGGRAADLEYPLAGTLHRRRLNASRNAGLLATVHAPRVNYERELIARPGPVGDETPTQRDQLSLGHPPAAGRPDLGGRRDA